MTVWTVTTHIDSTHWLRDAIALYAGKMYATREAAVEAAHRLVRAALWNGSVYRGNAELFSDRALGTKDRRYVEGRDLFALREGRSDIEYGIGAYTVAETEYGVEAEARVVARQRGSWSTERFVAAEDGRYIREPAVFTPPGAWADVFTLPHGRWASEPTVTPYTVTFSVYVSEVPVLAGAPDYTGERD